MGRVQNVGFVKKVQPTVRPAAPGDGLHAAHLQRLPTSPTVVPTLNHAMVKPVPVEGLARLANEAQPVHDKRCPAALRLRHFHPGRRKDRLAGAGRRHDQNSAGTVSDGLTGLLERGCLIRAKVYAHAHTPAPLAALTKASTFPGILRGSSSPTALPHRRRRSHADFSRFSESLARRSACSRSALDPS